MSAKLKPKDYRWVLVGEKLESEDAHWLSCLWIRTLDAGTICNVPEHYIRRIRTTQKGIKKK